MELPLGDIFVVALCVAGSAFFSGAETALTSLGELRVHQLLESGGRGQRLLMLWRDRPNRVLTTILIGNNLVNMLAAGLSTELAYRLMPGAVGEANRTALAVAVGGITLLVLIFGEIMPKTFAKHNAERFLLVSPLLVGCYLLLRPASAVFVRISLLMARLTGTHMSHHGPLVRVEDIEHMVRVGAAADALDKQQARYLSGILEMSETVAREIMVPRTEITALDEGSDLATVLEIIGRDRYSRYPVFQEKIDEITGTFYTKDLMDLLARDADDSFQVDALSRPPRFVPETQSVRDLLKVFLSEKVHMAIVVDEFGGTAGLVTLEDVIEEIVGEIYDEYDDDEAPIHREADGTFELEGTAFLRDLGPPLGIEFPQDDDYDTIAGFLVHEAGELPEVGYGMEYEGYRFTVASADERRVISVNAERLPEPPDANEAEVEAS